MKMIIISHEVDNKANVTLHFQGSFKDLMCFNLNIAIDITIKQ